MIMELMKLKTGEKMTESMKKKLIIRKIINKINTSVSIDKNKRKSQITYISNGHGIILILLQIL